MLLRVYKHRNNVITIVGDHPLLEEESLIVKRRGNIISLIRATLSYIGKTTKTGSYSKYCRSIRIPDIIIKQSKSVEVEDLIDELILDLNDDN